MFSIWSQIGSKRRRSIHSILQRLVVLSVPLMLLSDSAMACSVCFGDPESPMMKGAVAGVYVMVGFISSLLICIATTACFWSIRARRLAKSGVLISESP